MAEAARKLNDAPKMSNYWSKMTPEERSTEMKRRRAKAVKPKRKYTKRAKKFACKQCGELFVNVNKLANHVRYKHPKNKGVTSHGTKSSEAQIAYAFGHCEAWLQGFCERFELPVKDVARKVGGFLQR